jgi:hypothetical protein
MFGVWCAIGYLVALFIGWGAIAGFLPPTAPSADAAQIATLYHGDYTRIRIGMLVVMLSALIFIPFAAVTSQFIARIEGTAGVLTYTFLLGAAGNMVLTFYPAVWWLTAAFRPDRRDEVPGHAAFGDGRVAVRQESRAGLPAMVRVHQRLVGVDGLARSAAVLFLQRSVCMERPVRHLGPGRRLQRLLHRQLRRVASSGSPRAFFHPGAACLTRRGGTQRLT